MCVGDAGIIVVWSVMERAVRRVSFDKRGLGHSGIRQHKPPLPADEIQGIPGLVGQVMRLQLEAANEGRYRLPSLRSGCTIRAPAVAQRR